MKIWIFLSSVIFLFKQVKQEVFEQTVIYPLPFYNEVAPCSCDLTAEKCDAFCCCDQDCPNDYHGNWTCIQGLQGGQNPGKFIANNCSYGPQLFESDFESVLCIVKSRSSYLGAFYEEQTEVNGLLKPATTSPLNSFAKNSPRSSLRNKIYKHGYPVRVVYNESEGIYGNLQLPSKLGSKCIWSPVQFLRDKSTKCVRKLTVDLCKKNTILDYQMFLMPLPSGIDVDNVPKVLKVPFENEKIMPEISYFASTQPEMFTSSRRRRRKSQFQNNESANQNSASNIDLILMEIANLNDQKSYFKGASDGKCVKMAQFPVDDLHQEDQVHLEGAQCINAVLEVNYRVFWRANEITKISANILLGNLTLVEDKDLQQIFSVDFVHDSGQNQKTLSGNPGYEIGKPIDGMNNETKEVMAPKIWQSNSLLCQSSGLRAMTFLEDTQSGCALQLLRENFTDCDHLRNEIRRLQAELIETKLLIAKGGGEMEDDDWVPAIFEDFSIREQNTSSHPTCHVPSHLHAEISYTNNSGIHRINGFKINYFPEKWTYHCLGSKKQCSTRNFQMRSTVQFIEIPLVWHHQNTSKFWILQRLDLCEGDKCWKELLFPFSHNEDGESVAYATLCGLALLPATLAICWFTRDFW